MIVVNSDVALSDARRIHHRHPCQARATGFRTVGPATTQHIGFEQLKRLASINVTYVPYPGGAPAMTALLGGHVHAVLANYSEAMEQLHAGKVRALASTSLNTDRAASRRALGRGARLQELQRRGLVRRDGAGEDAERQAAQLAGWFKAAINAPEVTPRLSRSAFIRSAPASMISPRISAANTTNTAALSARRILGANSIRDCEGAAAELVKASQRQLN